MHGLDSTCSVSEQPQRPKQCPLGQPWHRGGGSGTSELPACCRSSSTSSETFTRFPCAVGCSLPHVRAKLENNPVPWTLPKRKHVNMIRIFELVSPRSARGSASYVDSNHLGTLFFCRSKAGIYPCRRPFVSLDTSVIYRRMLIFGMNQVLSNGRPGICFPDTSQAEGPRCCLRSTIPRDPDARRPAGCLGSHVNQDGIA